MEYKQKTMNANDVKELLSETLIKVSKREISLKQANMISKLSNSLIKTITIVDLENRVKFIESAIKLRNKI